MIKAKIDFAIVTEKIKLLTAIERKFGSRSMNLTCNSMKQLFTLLANSH